MTDLELMVLRCCVYGNYIKKQGDRHYCPLQKYVTSWDTRLCVHQTIPPIEVKNDDGSVTYRYQCLWHKHKYENKKN